MFDRDKYLWDVGRLIYGISLALLIYGMFVSLFPQYFPAVAGLGVVLIGSLIFAILLFYKEYLT